MRLVSCRADSWKGLRLLELETDGILTDGRMLSQDAIKNRPARQQRVKG